MPWHEKCANLNLSSILEQSKQSHFSQFSWRDFSLFPVEISIPVDPEKSFNGFLRYRGGIYLPFSISPHFWAPFFLRLLTSSVKLLLTPVKNDVSSIFHENGIENNLEKVNEIFLCPRVCQWTLGSSNKVGPKFW